LAQLGALFIEIHHRIMAVAQMSGENNQGSA